MRSRGLRIPEDISVAGFDNYRMIADTLFPSLTTVDLPYATMGVRAAQLLMALLQDDPPQDTGPQLVSGPVCWRDSVATISPANSNVSAIGRRTK